MVGVLGVDIGNICPVSCWEEGRERRGWRGEKKISNDVEQGQRRERGREGRRREEGGDGKKRVKEEEMYW